MKKSGFWNLPNTLTVGRIAMVPVMVWLLWATPTTWSQTLASSGVFVGAMLTDILDGYLARKWDLVSPAGAYLDPMADKLMVTATLVMLVPLGWVPAWLVVILLSRELAITGLRGIASQEGMIISASALGKLKTAYQSTALGIMLLHFPLLGLRPQAIGLMLLYIATALAVLSATEYFVQFFRQSAAITRR